MKNLIFTGITPSGTLTLGNYIGVIRHLIKLQNDHTIFLMIADLHALTTRYKQKVNYFEKSKEMAALLYACGLKEENCKIFIQSQIKEHLELSYLLSSYCSNGRLSNMIQFKEKSHDQKDSNLSLFAYPVLMASDILLYDADIVIVGKDQKQHLELTKYLANKFNEDNNGCLKIPSFLIPDFGSKIMGLKNPRRKMSKSGDDYISLLDDYQQLRRKIMKAETDSEGVISYDPIKKPGISNLLTIYSSLKGLSIEDVQISFSTSSYSQLKNSLFKEVISLLEKIKLRFNLKLEKVEDILRLNSTHLRIIAKKKLMDVKKEIGIFV